MSKMKVSNLTKQMIADMIKEGKRFDGRKEFDLRNFEVETGVSNKAEGSARVRLGKTEVLVGVKMSTGEPYADSKNKGNLIVSGDLLPLASPRFEHGPPGFDAIELPRLTDRMLRESGFIDFEKLCIKEGENVWNLFVDIYPINDDGALVDASSIAAVAALKSATFPGIDDQGKADYKNRTKDKLPLSDEIVPISFTFYKIEDKILLDPTREESEACDTKVTWGISKWNGQYMLNSCQKGWETPFNSSEVKQMMKALPEKYEEVMKKLNKALK